MIEFQADLMYNMEFQADLMYNMDTGTNGADCTTDTVNGSSGAK